MDKRKCMKYSINLNQLVLSETNLDIKDGAILEYLKAFCMADDKKVKQLTISEGGIDFRYTWINFNYLIKEMPLLKIKQKASISERIKKIEKEGFIKTFRAPDRSLYIRLMPKIKELEFRIGKENGVSENKQKCSPKLTGVLAKTNSTIRTISNKKINVRLAKPTVPKSKRKEIMFRKEWYDHILKEYQRLRGIILQGKEFEPVQQAIKTMFMSGRSVKNITDCMCWLAEKAESGEKKWEWTQNWTIRTVKLKLPEYVAGNFNEPDIEIPEYARAWQK